MKDTKQKAIKIAAYFLIILIFIYVFIDTKYNPLFLLLLAPALLFVRNLFKFIFKKND